MLTGMTGFTQLSSRFKDIQLNLEMRSLNHRFLDCLAHLPDGFAAVEDAIKAQVRNKINRGRLTITLSIARAHPKVLVDYTLADNYVRNLKALNQRLKLHDNLSLSQIVNLEGVLKIEKISLTPEFTSAIKALLNKGLEKLLTVRRHEGRMITQDVLKRLTLIRNEVGKINQAVKELGAQKKKNLSEDEYGAFLKSTDIAEELTRISYHVKNFFAMIKKAGTSGKELDFISQEIQREANTISAKAQSGEISSSVVKIKSAIEQIREQLQNVE